MQKQNFHKLHYKVCEVKIVSIQNLVFAQYETNVSFFFYSIFGQCLHVYGSFWMHRCIQREKEDKMNDVELFFQRRQLFFVGTHL